MQFHRNFSDRMEQLRNISNTLNAFRQESQQLKNELEQLKIKLNETEIFRQNAIKQMKDVQQLEITAKEMKEKCGCLESTLSSFTQYESVKTVKQIEEYIKTLNRNFKSTIQELTFISEAVNEKECSNVIEQQMAKYRQRKTELSQAGIALTSEPDFSSMIKDYDNICMANTERINDLFKSLYEATKAIEHKIIEFHLKIKNVAQFMERQNNELKELDRKSIQDSMDAEKQMYAYILEKIAERMKAFDALGENKCPDNESTGSNGSSIIIHNISESDDNGDDLSKVKKFLSLVNLETKLDVRVKRLESLEMCRPLKVTFVEFQLVEKLLQLPEDKISLLGEHVRITKCNK